MATVSETIGAPQELASGLQLGTTTLSQNQTLSFVLYKRLVLPVDGFVFWVKASSLQKRTPALYDYTPYDTGTFNSTSGAQLASESFSILGSLHYFQEIHQEEDTTYTRQLGLFTSTKEVNDFARLAPDELYITTLPNGTRIAFNGQIGRYDQAGLWHYNGRALYSTEATQVLESATQLNTQLQIVSNSLPIWLAMSTSSLPVYPSYLSGLNIYPPYITADITGTTAMGQSPVYGSSSSQSQLVTEQIKFTLYGLNNNVVLDFQTMLLNNSLPEDAAYGVMNMPVPIDDKKVQSEFQIIAQKKTMILQVNYYQSRARNIARQLIEQAGITLTPESLT